MFIVVTAQRRVEFLGGRKGAPAGRGGAAPKRDTAEALELRNREEAWVGRGGTAAA